MSHVLVVGSTVVDLSFYTDRIPVVGETVTGRFVQGLGGKGFNQAVASALSGASTRFVSAVGPLDQDAFSPLFRDRLKTIGIQTALEPIAGEATGAAAISVDRQGKNNIIVSLGANDHLSPDFLDRHQDFFRDVGVLLLQFETNLKVIEHALTLARRLSPGVMTILNPAPARTDIPGAIMDQVDLFTPNETELELISGHKIHRDEDLLVACAKIKGPKAILATLGEKGCFYYPSSGGPVSVPQIKTESKFFPAFKVKATDTTGAGDAFNGALAAGWVESHGDLSQAIRFASAVAAISVQRPGTSGSMPKQQEVVDFLQQQGREL